MALMAVLLPGALAVDLNIDVGFYFKQSRGGTCTLASAAMMLRYTFGLGQEADAIENAVKSVLDQGYRTPDLCRNDASPPGLSGWDGQLGGCD